MMAKKHRGSREKQRGSKKKPQRRQAMPAPRSAPVNTSHYAALGISPDADGAAIRDRYLELVRKFPPESEAESFQTIRLAYEVLSDPKSRRSYDRQRFHGITVTQLETKIARATERGKFDESLRLLEILADIEESAENYTLLAGVYDQLSKPAQAEEMYQRAFSLAENDDERWIIQSALIHRGETDEEIIDQLLECAKTSPKNIQARIASELLTHYANIDEEQKAMAYYRRLISRKKYPTVDDFTIYLDWLDSLLSLDLHDEYEHLLTTKVMPAATKAAVGPDQEAIRTLLVQRMDQRDPDPDRKFHLALSDLARTIAPNDTEVKQLRRQFADAAILHSQFSRAIHDPEVPTWAVRNVCEWYHVHHHVKMVDVDNFYARRMTVGALSPDQIVERVRCRYPRLYQALGPHIPEVLIGAPANNLPASR